MIKYIQTIAIILMVAGTASVPGLSAEGTRMSDIAMPAYSRSTSSIQGQVDSLRVSVQYMKTMLDLMSRKRDDLKERVRAGLAPESELAQADAELMEAMTRLEQTVSALQEVERLAALAKPVDADLKSAGIRQAAEVLSKAGSVRITVDSGVPEDLYVTLQAKRTPLGAVLEMMADSAHLVIAPGENGSIVLAPMGEIEINGQKVTVWASNLPWTEEWPLGGAANSPVGQRWLSLRQAAAPAPAIPAGRWPMGSSSQTLLTSMGPGSFVIGEPGSEKGEPGLWLTFYSVDHGRVVPGTKYFHRFTDPEKK